MNVLNKILFLLFVSLAVVSCTRDYDAPPIPEPKFDGKANITISELKNLYSSTTEDAPSLIDVDYVLKAYVTSSDQSGNIFKQLFIEDATGGINIGVDQSSLYTVYRPGQEIFIKLHGLYVVKYAGELQIGDKATNANRVPWEKFERITFLNGWPNANNITPIETSISALTPNMVNMLVKIDNVSFTNGGKNKFTANSKTTNEPIKDANGKTLDVRSSSYASFAEDVLPTGTGSVVGLLGRFNGSWQLFIRSADDLIGFTNTTTPTDPVSPTNPVEESIFSETFGAGTYASGNRLKIADFTDFDMKAPVKYSDQSGGVDIRTIGQYSDGAHVWFGANKDSYLTITGINTVGKQNLMLSFTVAANLYDSNSTGDVTGNLNAITVKCDGKTLTVPSTPVAKSNDDDNKIYTFEFKNIPAKENLEIEFFASASTGNTFGLRLDNIKILTAK